jgi:hypothetical protein
MAVPRAWGGSAVTSSVSKRIAPESMATKPAIERSRVVLPQPEGPSTAVSRPASNSREMACSASTEP